MFPNDADGDALRRVASNSDLAKPMKIDFMVAVPSRNAAELIASRVGTHGYTPSVEQDQETKEWTCYCTKEMVATYEGIIAAQDELDALSRDLGGYTDGWGTFGNG